MNAAPAGETVLSLRQEQDLRRLGPFFTIVTHGDRRLSPGWLPWSELADPVSPVLENRVERVHQALASAAGWPASDVDPKIAGSVTQLGLAARVVAPLIAIQALTGLNARRAAEGLWWRDELGGPFPLAVPESGWTAAPPHVSPIEALVGPVSRRIGTSTNIPLPVLWGNVASAINSAAKLLVRHRPDRSESAYAAARSFLDDPRLANESSPLGEQFTRATCCQIHRLAERPGRSVCGDCVLNGVTSPST